MRTSTIKVTQIHCGSCENTIRAALSQQAGVGAVVASAERNDVRVSYDATKVSEGDLRTLLEDVGFEPVA